LDTPRPSVNIAQVNRAALALTVLLGAAVATSTAATGSTTKIACGSERWTVKTLQDRPRLKPTKNRTIAQLIAIPTPSSLPATRLPDEFAVYRVTAQVTLVRHESDEDFHLVVQDAAGNYMIVEVPSGSCVAGATPLRRQQMANARTAATTCTKAVMIGVLFHDFFHHQTGVAPNVIELHPLLAFRCLTP
jgi:hypothetical protein